MPKKKQSSNDKTIGDTAKQIAIAMQIPFALVVPIFVGGGIGYLLDQWLHTRFMLTFILGIVGFGVGLREVIKMANIAEDKNDR